MDFLRTRNLVLFGVTITILGAAANLVLGLPLLALIAALGTIVLIFLLLDYPLPTLLCILGVRMIVDAYTDTTLSVLFFSLNLGGMMALALMLATGIFLIAKKQSPARSGLIPYTLFVILCALSIGWSFVPFASLTDLIRFLSFGCVLILSTLIINSRERLTAFIRVIPATLLAPIGFAIQQLATGSGYFEIDRFKPVGTFFHPNYLGYASLIGLTAVIANLHQIAKKETKTPLEKLLIVFYCVFGLVLTFFVFASDSLGAQFAFFLTLAIMIPLSVRKSLIALPITLFVAALLFPLYNFALQQRGIPLLESPAFRLVIGESKEEGSFTWRVKNWESMFGFFLQKPIFGWGTGTYRELRVTRFEFATDIGAPEAHNDYMNFIVETGLVGLLLLIGSFVSFVFMIVKNTWERNPRSPRSPPDPIRVWILSLLLATMIAMTVENLFRGASIMWPLFALLGAALSQTDQQTEKHKT